MKDESVRKSFEAIARHDIPENIDLWPRIAVALEQKNQGPLHLKWKLAWTIILALLGLSAITGVAYAIARITGYLPGIGFVQTSSLRILADPVSETRAGITVTIEQVIVDSERTVVVYKTEGLTIAAANSKGEGGPFGSNHHLRLPNGEMLEEDPNIGYAGTPEPLVMDEHTQSGQPNYVLRLVFPRIPPQVDEIMLLIPILQTMPAGAAPENWALTFHLKAAPAEMTFAPIIGLTQPTGPGEATPVDGVTGNPVLATSSTLNGITFSLENVIELDNGFVFTGNLSWEDAAFPTVNFTNLQASNMNLTDSNNQGVPIEEVPLVNGSYIDDNHSAWSYRTNRKAFSGPLVLSISSITATMIAPDVNLELDLGSNPQIGQIWEIDRDFVIIGHTLRLLSVQLVNDSNPCWKFDLNFNFESDQADISANVIESIPQTALEQTCSGGGGGGSGPVDPKLFTTPIRYNSLPTGLHQFIITSYIPYTVSGPWQVSWDPPLASELTPTPEPGACLTLEKWDSLISLNDPLPSGLGGKIVTTVNEGALLPSIYVSNLDGSGPGKIDTAVWPSLSADGTRLVYSGADGLHVFDLLTGKNTLLGTDGYRLIWSPDGNRILFTTTSDIYVVNADGSGLQKIDTGSAEILSSVGWLPDNQTILYSALGGNGYTFISYNMENYDRKELFSFQNKAGYGAISPDGQWIVFSDKGFGEENWGIFIARLDGSERKLVASWNVPTAFTSVWVSGTLSSSSDQWLILNTQNADGNYIPVLVNPFTCQATRMQNINGIVEGWSP